MAEPKKVAELVAAGAHMAGKLSAASGRTAGSAASQREIDPTGGLNALRGPAFAGVAGRHGGRPAQKNLTPMILLPPGIRIASQKRQPGAIMREPIDEAEVTGLLRRWDEDRDEEALNAALPVVIGELRRQARAYLAREDPDHTMQPTDLVHEAYLRLLGSRVGKIGSRGEFFAFAARVMRQILIESARRRVSEKRGGKLVKTGPAAALEVPEEVGLDPERLLVLYQALERLGKVNARQRQIAELRYLIGLTVKEIAQVLEISVATVERGWEAARLWLSFELGRDILEQA